MKTKTALLSTAIGSLLALSLTSVSAYAADDANMEKCYGIAQAGRTIVPAPRMPVPDNPRQPPARNGSNSRKAPASASSVEACPLSNSDGLVRRSACPRVDPGFCRDRPEGSASKQTAGLQARSRLARSP